MMNTIDVMNMLGRTFATMFNGRKILKKARTYMNNGLNRKVLPAWLNESA